MVVKRVDIKIVGHFVSDTVNSSAVFVGLFADPSQRICDFQLIAEAAEGSIDAQKVIDVLRDVDGKHRQRTHAHHQSPPSAATMRNLRMRGFASNCGWLPEAFD
jgi:hypothetical protein